MTGPVCQQIKAEVSSLCDAPPGRYLIMYEIDIRAFGGSLSTCQPPPPPPLGLLVSPRLSARRVPSFASSSCTHVPPPLPSFSLFPIVSYLLLDRRWWCISSLGVKSCQVCCSALNLLRTGNKTGKKSFDYDHVIYLDEWKKRFPDIVFMYRHLFSYQIFVTKNTNEVYSSKSYMPKYIQIRVFPLIIPFFAMILKRKEPSKKRSRKRSFFFERNMIIR